MMVSVFKDIYEKDKPFYRHVDVVLNLIKDGRYRNKIHEIRILQTKEERDRLKVYLPSICFSGKFTSRHDSKLTEHSGLVVLDFDHVENLEQLKTDICRDKYTFAAFISPSGDGLKVLVKIPPVTEDHEAYYMGLIKKYPNLDTTSRNKSRVCFMSYDPELFHNPDSQVFDKKDSLPKKDKSPKRVVNAQETDYSKLNIIAKIIRDSIDGEKHHALIRASRLAGGFIAGGLVEEHEAVRVLEIEINQKNISDFKNAQKTIRDGIEYGKRSPIYEAETNKRVEQAKAEEIIIETEPAKDVILLNDVRSKILYTYEHGTSLGETTHFPQLDEVFRHKRGEITLMHGIGNHGKSQMLMQLLLVKALKDGYKYGVFSPENMPVEEFYKDIIHAYVGKSTERHHSNQMSREELDVAMDFVNDHFFLIYPENEDPTPDYINKRFNELIIKHKIDGCVIDPYNQLDNDINRMSGREDLYLSMFLTKAKKFAVSHNVFYYIITHPKSGLKKDGLDYECPNVFDLSGGAMWNNKCDNILVTHRPYYTSDKTNTDVLFKSQKIKKQKLNGIPGDVLLFFDRRTSRYYQMDDYSPLGWIEKENESKSIFGFNDQLTVPF